MYDRDSLAQTTCFVPTQATAANRLPTHCLDGLTSGETTVQDLLHSGVVTKVNGLDHICKHLQTNMITSTTPYTALNCGQAGLGTGPSQKAHCDKLNKNIVYNPSSGTLSACVYGNQGCTLSTSGDTNSDTMQMLRACSLINDEAPSTPDPPPVDLDPPPVDLDSCKKLIGTTDKWCGQLAGWGTGSTQQELCENLPRVLHRPSNGEMFTCTYNSDKGCRKGDVDTDLLDIAQACVGDPRWSPSSSG
jgi:hypothetical protein